MEPAGVLQPIPTTIARLTGPLLVGYLLNWGLFGVLTVQCYIYYLAFPRDRQIFKALVAFMFVFELLQTVLCTRDGFREFGSGWGYLPVLDEVGWLWFSMPFIEAIVSCTFQLFYAWRIWVLRRSLWIPGMIILLAIMQGGMGIYTAAFANIQQHVSQFQDRSFKTTAIWLGAAALCDIIITVSMMYYWRQAKTGHKASTTALTKSVNLTVQTGLVCTAFSILHLALFLATPKQNYHFAPTLILSKLYSNSILVVFNARLRIHGGRNIGQDNIILSVTTFESDISFQSFRARPIGIMSPHNTVPISGIAVDVSNRGDAGGAIKPGTGKDSIDVKNVQMLAGSTNDLTANPDRKRTNLA